MYRSPLLAKNDAETKNSGVYASLSVLMISMGLVAFIVVGTLQVFPSADSLEMSVGAPASATASMQDHLSNEGAKPADQSKIERAPKATGYQVIKFNTMAELNAAHPPTKSDGAWEYHNVPVKTYMSDGSSYSQTGTIRITTDSNGLAEHVESFVADPTDAEKKKAESQAESHAAQLKAVEEKKAERITDVKLNEGVTITPISIINGIMKCKINGGNVQDIKDVGAYKQGTWESEMPSKSDITEMENDREKWVAQLRAWKEAEKIFRFENARSSSF